MKKTITITEENGAYKIDVTGFNQFEAMGILRYYEKYLWLHMADAHGKQGKPLPSEPPANPSPEKKMIDCEFGARLINVVRAYSEDFGRDNIVDVTLSDLTKVRKRRWYRFRNFGKGSMHILEKVLAENNLQLT